MLARHWLQDRVDPRDCGGIQHGGSSDDPARQRTWANDFNSVDAIQAEPTYVDPCSRVTEEWRDGHPLADSGADMLCLAAGLSDMFDTTAAHAKSAGSHAHTAARVLGLDREHAASPHDHMIDVAVAPQRNVVVCGVTRLCERVEDHAHPFLTFSTDAKRLSRSPPSERLLGQ